ncbi:claudin-8-like [Hyperolius riggenbachi]|uniref:claudin-8-like n=1 Tax=Hyperolius riggenbachi TaxID=752182 RepID=UPI0035A2D8DE
MGCILMHILGIIFGGIGVILTWVITFMVQWRLVVLAENNGLVIETGRIDGTWFSRYDGLWLTCLYQYKETMHCTTYNTQVSLTPDLKASRVFMCFALGLTVLAFFCSILGIVSSCCCSCCCCSKQDRHCLTLTAGILYLISLVLIYISVVWVTIYITQKSYSTNLTQGAVRIEIGEALMVAWPCIAFILFSGIDLIVIWSCACGCPRPKTYCNSYKLPMEQRKVQQCNDDCSDVRASTPRMQYL